MYIQYLNSLIRNLSIRLTQRKTFKGQVVKQNVATVECMPCSTSGCLSCQEITAAARKN